MNDNKSVHFIEIKGLTKYFGGLEAVVDFNLQVNQGEILGLIGPNGAGKSTVLNMIGGTLLPSRGKVFYKGEDVSRLPSYKKAQRGIARLYQANILFNSFSALENVLVGLHLQAKISLAGVLLRRGSINRQEKALREKALSLLELVGLNQYSDEVAQNLPHGRQRLLGMAVALAVSPELILLDEPVTGMTADEVKAMMDMVRTLRDKHGVTCIIIEHNLRAVMGLCDRIAVLNFGQKIADGTPAEILENPAVTEAYLGSEEDVT